MIGILDLQGGVAEHREHLEYLEVGCVSVKKAEHLKGISGLIIPGGESTCLSKLLEIFSLKEPILAAHRNGMKIWGTCAGAILLATEIGGESPYFSVMEMAVQRNSFGSQMDSFTTEALVDGVDTEPIPLVFIRAPKIIRVGGNVRILLKMGDYIAAAESADALVTIFHPELTNNSAFHRYFAAKCGEAFAKAKLLADPGWRETSWMGSGEQSPK
ncbi:MAG: pyridoxal 5'-phosphate synthase glutaminase subunit PdxT [Deltaproteobacteria bacterium]|nr:pyridoxal 5'-phosphate synthase glutaminase subunit PdxT [Deltaproteobacteria bacterium]